MKCLSKLSLDAEYPSAYHMIGDLLAKFKQIGPRVTEFKAVVSNAYIRMTDRKEGAFKTIEKALEQMPNLKILEVDGDPYWMMVEDGVTTLPYPLDKI
jgi:hypothetical protein